MGHTHAKRHMQVEQAIFTPSCASLRWSAAVIQSWAIGCSGVWCTLGLLSYFSHQHSEVLLAAILPFKAEDGTR